MMQHNRTSARFPVRGITLALLCTAVSNLFADGLPGEYLVTSRWRTLLAAHSPLNNPAFLTEENYLIFRLASTSTFGEFYMHELGGTLPIGLYQSAGLTWMTLGTPKFDKTVWGGPSGDSIAVQGTTSDNQNLIVASYAINPWNRLSVGLNINLAHHDQFGELKLNYGADIGISYRLIRHPAVGDHVLGISIQNLLAPKLGVDVFARTLRFSLISNYWEKRIESSLEWTMKDLLADGGEFQNDKQDFNAAAASMEWDLDARVGTWLFRIAKLYLMTGLHGFGQNFEYSYWGFALGANLPHINMGRDLSMLYQFMRMPNSTALSHTGYLLGEFGLHREEIWARKMARLASLAPNDLYTRAVTLYSNRQFWDAFFLFGRLCAEFPDFFKQDWVTYYMASCQEELDMRDAALAGYATAKGAYPKSTAIPYTDLGMMRVYYRQGLDGEVSSQFLELDKPEVPDTLRYHAYYIMAQSLIRSGDYGRAINLLEQIPVDHPEYIFAQHSLGHAAIMTGKVTEAIGYFENTSGAKATTAAQKEMVNRSMLMEAYLLYENLENQESALARAVLSLRKIPKESYYYEDALLGLGWCAARARQWKDCSDAADGLIKTSTKVVLQAEGGLLKGYSLLMDKDYTTAVTVLSDATEKIAGASIPGSDSLEREKSIYALNREDYDTLAQKASRLSLTRQSAFVLAQIDSLSGRQKTLEKDIRDHYVFVDELERLKLFSLGAEAVKEDLGYALAKAKRMSGVQEQTDTKKKALEQQKGIDQEIQKLQEEMNKIDQKQQ